MDDSIDYALARATPDVDATMRWLVDQGAAITRSQGGSRESFGNVLVEFTFGDAVVTVTRDRGQWMLDVEFRPLRRFDFDLIYVAMTGDHRHWVRAAPRPMPSQLPDGVSWSRGLPGALAWLRSTPNADQELLRLAQQRAKLIFG